MEGSVKVFPRRITILLVLIAALQIYDVLSTRLVLELGGYEANPLMAPLVLKPLGLTVKTLWLTALTLTTLIAYKRCSKLIEGLICFLVAFYMFIAFNNTLNFLTLLLSA